MENREVRLKNFLYPIFKEKNNMIKNGKGGGNTKTGLVFEGKTDLATFLNDQNGYRVVGNIVFYNC